MVPNDPESRARATLLAWVTGEGSLSTFWSGLRGVPQETVRRVLTERRAEFERLDPARAVLLDSLVGRKAP